MRCMGQFSVDLSREAALYAAGAGICDCCAPFLRRPAWGVSLLIGGHSEYVRLICTSAGFLLHCPLVSE